MSPDSLLPPTATIELIKTKRNRPCYQSIFDHLRKEPQFKAMNMENLCPVIDSMISDSILIRTGNQDKESFKVSVQKSNPLLRQLQVDNEGLSQLAPPPTPRLRTITKTPITQTPITKTPITKTPITQTLIMKTALMKNHVMKMIWLIHLANPCFHW